jgi:hypothetical protein
MIDKYTGQVACAVMSFSGFLVISESYHPLPWKALIYDLRLGGYVIDVNRGTLEGTPSYRAATCQTGPIVPTLRGSTNTRCRLSDMKLARGALTRVPRLQNPFGLT